jgi:hypothetical protein
MGTNVLVHFYQISLGVKVSLTLLFFVCVCCFEHANAFGGQPYPSWLMPLVLSATSEGALLFVVRSGSAITGEEGRNGPVSQNVLDALSKITVKFKINGNRRKGAHAPVRKGASVPAEEEARTLTFTDSFVLQMLVLEQLLSVGMLPLPSLGPRVGQQVVFQWRIERLQEGWIKQTGSNGDVQKILPTKLSSSEVGTSFVLALCCLSYIRES